MFLKSLLLSSLLLSLLNANESSKISLSPVETLGPVFVKEHGLNIYTTMEYAMLDAKKSNKNILLYAAKEGCPYCKQMEDKIIPIKKVTEYINKNYIFVKLMKGDKIFTGKLTPPGYPAFYILDHKKQLLNSSLGYSEEQEFLDFLKEK
jgi:thioredoxin-related protein